MISLLCVIRTLRRNMGERQRHKYIDTVKNQLDGYGIAKIFPEAKKLKEFDWIDRQS